MSDYEPPQPGWWQASDGNWYPPESHPDRRAAAQPPPPIPPPISPMLPAPGPPPPVPPGMSYPPTPPSSQSPWWRRWWVIAIGAVAVLGVIASVASNSAPDGTDRGDPVPEVAASSNDDRDVDVDTSGTQEEPEVAADSSTATDESTSVPGDDEAKPTVSNSGPLAFGALVPVVFESFGDADGSVWNVRVTKPQDVTAAVLASNPFNDPPPDGIVFAGFDVEMTLASAGKEPLSPGFNFSWEILGGSTAAVYDPSTVDGFFGCGVLDAEFDDYSEVFVGGTLTGTVCIPIPAADLDAPSTQVAMNFSGERVTFSTSGSSPPPVEVTGADGSTSAGVERALGVLVPVQFDTFGDADGSVWNVVVSPLRDMTTEVREANPFNDEAPDGVVFAGFHLEMTLASARKVPLSTGFNVKFEVLGGATASVYDLGTIADLFGCGVFPDDFNEHGEVFVGGTIDGTICIPLPAEDLAHSDTRIAFNIDGQRVLFLPGGPTPEAGALEAGGGPASVGESHPTGAATQIEWDSLGDADHSIWTTTVGDVRDMTADVLAANPFNDRPPEGVGFLGFDIEMTLVESQKEPLSAGFNFEWEILGGESRRVYDTITFSDVIGCGVVNNDFDQYAEVFKGGTLSGTVCIPVPLADLDHPDTRISMKFDDSRVTFRPS